MPKKLLFIFNPLSGKGRIKYNLLDITDIFTKSGYDVTVRPTQSRGDTYEYIKEHGTEYQKIVVSGGDGTLSEAVEGLMTVSESERCALGYIPSGSTNDFASALNIPKNMCDAAKTAVSGTLFKCDVGNFNGRTFNYVAAFGAFTDVSYDTPQEFKNALGHMAYVWEGMKRLPSLTSYRVKIRCGENEIEDNIFLCIILNSTSVAGLRNTDKLMDVNLSDGLFEMLVFKRPTNIAEFQSVLTGLMRGESVGEGYMILKAPEFEFISDEEIKWTLDGEYGGSTSHAVIKVMPSAVTYTVGNEPQK